MSVSRDFGLFLDNLKIKNSELISKRYGSITRRLNLSFRNSDSKTANSLQAGSYGRHSGVHGISDLDMLYIMPSTEWESYKNNPAALLDICKIEIAKTYPKTQLKRDRNVVVISFDDYVIEVVPVFQQADGKFKYPDTYGGGSWKLCDTIAELSTFQSKNTERNGNLRRLAKMVRGWKERNSIPMSGFIIDTLCFRFFNNNDSYDSLSFGSYDLLIKDFFQFLVSEPERSHYSAMGSGSHATVGTSFKKSAQAALNNCQEAIKAREAKQYSKCNKLYKSVLGTRFPNRYVDSKENTVEEFIEDSHKIVLTHQIELECRVRDDLITKFLSKICSGNLRIQHQHKLNFFIKSSDIQEAYELKWKVLNQGHTADRKKDHRGQILDDDGSKTRNETATFFGDHIVECYAIQNGIVIARDIITVPIA